MFDLLALDPADAAVTDLIPPHDMPPAFGQVRPGGIELVADVNPDGIALADRVLLDDRVMAALGCLTQSRRR